MEMIPDLMGKPYNGINVESCGFEIPYFFV